MDIVHVMVVNVLGYGYESCKKTYWCILLCHGYCFIDGNNVIGSIEAISVLCMSIVVRNGLGM